MFRAAVIGSPISHSRSPVLHNAGYQALGLEGHYGAIDCTAEQLPAVVGGADPAFVGFSVTMPCKFAALSYADTATKRATAIGSANTLVRCDGMWCADNTDVDGVGGALDTLGVPTPHRVVMVGAGGTARAVVWALGFRGCQEVVILNRSNRVGGVCATSPQCRSGCFFRTANGGKRPGSGSGCELRDLYGAGS